MQKQSYRTIAATFFGICAPLAMAGDVNWTSVTDGDWNSGTNWSTGFEPTSSDDAKHLTQLSRIDVTSAGECLSFTMDADDPNDRFLTIGATDSLTVVGGIKNNGEAELAFIKLDGGTGSLARTTLAVGADELGVAMDKVRIWPLTLNDAFFELDLDGSVSNSFVFFAKDATIDIEGDITDTNLFLWNDAVLTVGSAAIPADLRNTGGARETISVRNDCDIDITGELFGAMDLSIGAGFPVGGATTFDVGSVDAMAGTWTLRNQADFTSEAGFNAGSNSISSLIRLQDSAKMTVTGITLKGHWEQSDNSEFIANSLGDEIIDGEWILNDSSTVTARKVASGDWTVADTALLDVSGDLAPNLLIADSGSVETRDMGRVNHAFSQSWKMEVKGGATVTVEDTTWHDGFFAGGVAFASELSYKGTGNLYKAGNFQFDGALVSAGVGAELTMEVVSGPTSAAAVFMMKTVRIDSLGNTQATPFDAEGVNLVIADDSFTPILESSSPDYWESFSEFNGSKVPVLFRDSPCAKRFKKVRAKDLPGSNTVILSDAYSSTPMSGTPNAEGSRLIPESFYTIDFEIESGVTVDVDRVDGHIYVENTPVINGTLTRSGSAYTPETLTVTKFGDFDGSGDGTDIFDTDLFAAAWCTCYRKTIPDTAYDPFADWDCDGDVDDDDRDQYNANWGTGVPKEVSAIASLSACDPATVCP